MIFRLFILVALISIIVAAIMKNKVAMIASGVAILVTAVIPIGIYTSNMGTLADLQAFYNASSTNFFTWS